MENLRKINNDMIKLEDLQKRLNKLQNKKYNLILSKTENDKTELKIELRFIEKNSNFIKMIKGFFDKTDVLFYIQGLEEMQQYFYDFK